MGVKLEKGPEENKVKCVTLKANLHLNKVMLRIWWGWKCITGTFRKIQTSSLPN